MKSNIYRDVTPHKFGERPHLIPHRKKFRNLTPKLIGGGGEDLILTSHFSSPHSSLTIVKWKKNNPQAFFIVFLCIYIFENPKSSFKKIKSLLRKAFLAKIATN